MVHTTVAQPRRLYLYTYIYAHRVDSRTVRHENRQQGNGPDEERKDHPFAGHVDVVLRVSTARNGVHLSFLIDMMM